MGCLLELLKSENNDYSVFKPVFVPDQANETPAKITKSDIISPTLLSKDVLVNGDASVKDDSTHFQKKVRDHSNHKGDHFSQTHAHSKKPDSLDLNIVNGDSSSIKPFELIKSQEKYSEHLADKDQHTSL